MKPGSAMNISHIQIEGLKGVGNVDLHLVPEQRVYAFIGENGIGKTKLLEAWCSYLLYLRHSLGLWPETASSAKDSSVQVHDIRQIHEARANKSHHYNVGLLKTLQCDAFPGLDYPYPHTNPNAVDTALEQYRNSSPLASSSPPIVLIDAKDRGYIHDTQGAPPPLGSFHDRRWKAERKLRARFDPGFASAQSQEDVEQWFVTRALSSSPYLDPKDNRKIEIDTLLALLHRIEPAIDPTFLSLDGNNRVSIKIEGEPRTLSQLSTGYASIVKILQTIISGYGDWTNSNDLAAIPGIVLIDEIESHLHLKWQSRIIPLLKTLFPQTTFFIATHSPLVLTQLHEGEVYRLERDEDGVVRSHIIDSPNKRILTDVLSEAFDLDVNKLKREALTHSDQSEAKRKLLALLDNATGEQP